MNIRVGASFRLDRLYWGAAAAIILLTETVAPLAAAAAGPVNETALQSAWSLYNQKNYVGSADAFEGLIRTSTPAARLYYYAAVANKGANRMSRAKQLCQYIIANFPSTTEADYAKKLFPGDATGAPATASAAGAPALDLPENLKGKTMEQLMETEEGRAALKDALNQQKAAAATGAVSSGGAKSGAKSSAGEQAFTAAMIARDGAGGITHVQSTWIECAMAAMATSPKGQKVLASMIRPGRDNSYIVRFPGEGIDYIITPKKMEELEVKDRAMWATVIHCALYLKFNNVSSANFEDILTFLAGKRAEKIYAANTTEQARISFITTALKDQDPVVASTSGNDSPELVEYGAYTITAFDPASGMITLRNPKGGNAERHSLSTDPDHKTFQQLNDGVCKMHISLFPRYFDEVARVML
ncbi:MAG TPA: hypothetical protein V6C72_12320 [Chroococcales cyanobacterium]